MRAYACRRFIGGKRSNNVGGPDINGDINGWRETQTPLSFTGQRKDIEAIIYTPCRQATVFSWKRARYRESYTNILGAFSGTDEIHIQTQRRVMGG